MRFIKMLGLAALAAAVATAFVGASTASAEFNTVLCSEPTLICENPVNGGGNVEIHLHAEDPKLLTNIGTVLCEASLGLPTLLNKLAVAPERQIAHLLALTLTGCSLGSTSCTITVSELGALLFLKIGELKASVTLSPLEGKKTKAVFKCGSFINCTYSASEATLLTATSDANGHLLIAANETPLAGSGFLCPKEAKWDADYKAVSLPELKLVPNLYIES